VSYTADRKVQQIKTRNTRISSGRAMDYFNYCHKVVIVLLQIITHGVYLLFQIKTGKSYTRSSAAKRGNLMIGSHVERHNFDPHKI